MPESGSVVSSPNSDFNLTQQLFQQIVSPIFVLQSGQFPVSGRHSFGVYEIWCFQQIIDTCTRICRFEPTVMSEDPLKWGGIIEWRCDIDVVRLHYNPRFVAFWERKNNSRLPYSLVGEQRPDFVLQYRDIWLLLDAKYRSTIGKVLNALSSASSYLTAQKIPHLQRDPVGCFLLEPKKLSESRYWFSQQFRKENGFGLVCCK